MIMCVYIILFWSWMSTSPVHVLMLLSVELDFISFTSLIAFFKSFFLFAVLGYSWCHVWQSSRGMDNWLLGSQRHSYSMCFAFWAGMASHCFWKKPCHVVCWPYYLWPCMWDGLSLSTSKLAEWYQKSCQFENNLTSAKIGPKDLLCLISSAVSPGYFSNK